MSTWKIDQLPQKWHWFHSIKVVGSWNLWRHSPMVYLGSIEVYIVHKCFCIWTLCFGTLQMLSWTTKIIRFFSPNENKGMPNSKSRSWNKKNKNKNTTCAKQDSNKIILQRKNKTRLWQKNVPKIGVEQTKGKGEFYLYLYSLNT